MIKKDYVKSISEKLELPQIEVDNVLKEFINELSKELSNNDKLSITNFGTFTKSFVKPNYSYSPIDGSNLNNDGYYRITFKCSKELMQKIKSNK